MLMNLVDFGKSKKYKHDMATTKDLCLGILILSRVESMLWFHIIKRMNACDMEANGYVNDALI